LLVDSFSPFWHALKPALAAMAKEANTIGIKYFLDIIRGNATFFFNHFAEMQYKSVSTIHGNHSNPC